MAVATVRIPPKLIPVFTSPARFRGAFGGRGSAKTRTFAKMAAVEAYRRAEAGETGIILCGREFMNSLDESSMAEVKNAITEEPWLAPYFDIGERYIRTANRRIEFKFAGLRHNIDSIKSKARVLILWVDEAEPVSQTAWDKIMPTVREEGSEIWVTWNPEREGSPTDDLFRKNPPPDSVIVEVNWEDNPWFPSVLHEQMEWDRARDPAKYAHIWGGGYLKRSEATVFRNWRVEDFDTPEDARFYFGADWGFAVDPTVLVRCWIDGRSLYVDYEAYEIGCEIDKTPALFDTVPGSRDWPCRADSARPETISYMRRNGFPRMESARKGAGSVEEGVEFLKSYDIIVHPRCRHTADELTHYAYKIDRQTDEVLPVLEDRKNHVIDALRYAVESLRRASNDDLPAWGAVGLAGVSRWR